MSNFLPYEVGINDIININCIKRMRQLDSTKWELYSSINPADNTLPIVVTNEEYQDIISLLTGKKARVNTKDMKLERKADKNSNFKRGDDLLLRTEAMKAFR